MSEPSGHDSAPMAFTAPLPTLADRDELELASELSEPRAPGKWHLVTVLGLAVLAMWLLSGGGRSVMFDTFRDMAWAHNVVGGRVRADPTLLGEPYWYAPGNPLAFGALASATGLGVVDIYRTSALWWNALLVVFLFAVACRVGGRLTGLLTLPMVCLGSPWWKSPIDCRGGSPGPPIRALRGSSGSGY